MSTELYDRVSAREQGIWPPFLYQDIYYDESKKHRAAQLGLYATYYLNGTGYLLEIETEERAWLLNEYTVMAAKLTAEQTALAAKIVSDKYLDQLKRGTFSKKLDTVEHENALKSNIMDAEIAAIDSDREVLTTMQNKINIAKQQADVKIQEIESRIDIEELKQQEVAAEISRKELEQIRTEQKIMDADLQIIDIQLKIARDALEVVKNSVQVTQIQTDIARTESDIAKTNLWGKDLEVVQAETETITTRAETEPGLKESLADSQKEGIEANTERISGLLTAYQNLHVAEKNEIDTMIAAYTDELKTKIRASQDEKTTNIDNLSLKKAAAELSAEITSKLLVPDDDHAQEVKRQSGLDYELQLSLVDIIRLAALKNTLTHTVVPT